MNPTSARPGAAAPHFTLPQADGAVDVSLLDFADAPALLVAFLCVHCPYVTTVEAAFGAFATEYAERGLAVVGISSNDTQAYPEDAPERMVEQAARAGFGFPYLFDATQEVARAYGAVCTPDLFLFDADRRLAYRGQFDDARPRNGVSPSGATIRAAADLVLTGKPVPEPHPPAVGCSLKWKPGNEPPVRLLFG